MVHENETCSITRLITRKIKTACKAHKARGIEHTDTLKIRVSMVRFRPRPPNKETPTRASWWGFCFGFVPVVHDRSMCSVTMSLMLLAITMILFSAGLA
jgi:hypothetical protein